MSDFQGSGVTASRLESPCIDMYIDIIPSWERIYPLPFGTFESMIFLFPFGGICFLVPWSLSYLAQLSITHVYLVVIVDP